MFARLLNFFRKPKADSLRVQLGADSPEKAVATASVATEKPVFLGALENDQLLSHLPKDFQTRVLLENGKLLVSDELRAKPELLSFVGLARRYGINQVEFVAPTVFDDRSRRLMNISVSMSDTDVEQYAKNLFQQAYDEGASDIHLLNTGAYGIVRFRRMGLIKDHSRLTGDLADRLISAIYGTMCQSTMDGTYSPMKRQEGRVAERQWLPSGVHSMRVHTEPIECVQSPTGVGAYMPIRLLYDRTNATGSLTDRAKALGYPQADCKRFNYLTQRTGLTIISGPTGHGKSTLLKHIMEAQTLANPEKCYLSLEDPVEYPMNGVYQIMISTKASADFRLRGQAYTDGLAGAMRSDPDVVMVGEIRYPEAASATIDMALTGHGVWATLHANNAFGIIRRMVSLLNAANYVDPLEYLCDQNVLAGLVYQRLLPVLCPECSIPMADLAGNRKLFKYVPRPLYKRVSSVVNPTGVRVHNPEGCEHCKRLGIVGQTVAAEVIVTDQPLLELLRKGDYIGANKYWQETHKGRTYVQHAIEHVGNGLVDPAQAELRLGVPLSSANIHDQFLLPSEDDFGTEANEAFPELSHGEAA